MRVKHFLAGGAAISLLAAALSEPSNAFDWGVSGSGPDPYAYSHTPRGYYPYYNSGYWGPPRVKRFRGELPPYFAAWGAPDRHYRHVEWHDRHYGRHRHHHW